MGPKRKSGKFENGVGAKKVKLESWHPVYRWQYEADKNTWIHYSDKVNKLLTDAFDKDVDKVDFELDNGTKLCVDFVKSVQRNKKTGWERPLRLALKDDATDAYHVWLWVDEHNRDNAYNAANTLLIEKAFIDKEQTIDIEACHRKYRIDITKQTQINIATNVERKMKRQADASVKPDPSGPKLVDNSGPAAAVDTKPGTSQRAKRGKSGSALKLEPVAEEEEVDVKKAKSKGKGKSGAKERPAVKTVVISGKAPVDSECTQLLGKAHVYYEGNDIYDCMLNQTNTANNNNKYFIIQLLEEDSRKSYYTWFRWGRVGYSGQNSLVPCGPNVDAAKKQFFKKFQDKTKNDWANRKKFVKVAGKYDMLEMDYSAKDIDETDSASLKKEPSNTKYPDSKLDLKIKSLIELICDVKSMEEAVMEMQYDAKKAPLGKLTKDQIKAGYAALKKIEDCVEKKDLGSALIRACDEFYTRIPHDFGMRPPTKISTKAEIKNKITLLEALGDIEIAMKMLKEGNKDENPVDRHYDSLKCDLDALVPTSDEFKMINTYLQNTHASTHGQYKMKLLDIFSVSKHGEKSAFNDLGNRHLLWHGSRLTNWMGILGQGLRIAPPEAPVTGYMFGKGVYFADMSSKSANYCFATKTKNVGLLLLCEVALGTTNDLLAADYSAHKLPAGKHSVKGAGKIAPDTKHTLTTDDGTIVPLGKPKDTGITNPHGYTLNYNEFIVYDTKQIQMKYLVKVQFDFKF